MTDLIVQIIGLIALAFIAASFQMRKRRGILYLQFCAGLLFALHFFLLGAFTGAALNMVSATRAALFGRYEHKHRPFWPLVLIITCFIGVTIVTWQGFISLLPLLGMISSSIGSWQRSPQRLRALTSISPPFWFVYDFFAGSIAGMITEIICFSSIAVGLWRYRNKPQHLQSFQKSA